MTYLMGVKPKRTPLLSMEVNTSCKTRPCVRTSDVWTNGFATRLPRLCNWSRKSRKFHACTVDLGSLTTCVDLGWVAKRWKSCVDRCVRIWARLDSTQIRCNWVAKRKLTLICESVQPELYSAFVSDSNVVIRTWTPSLYGLMQIFSSILKLLNI